MRNNLPFKVTYSVFHRVDCLSGWKQMVRNCNYWLLSASKIQEDNLWFNILLQLMKVLFGTIDSVAVDLYCFINNIRGRLITSCCSSSAFISSPVTPRASLLFLQEYFQIPNRVQIQWLLSSYFCSCYKTIRCLPPSSLFWLESIQIHKYKSGLETYSKCVLFVNVHAFINQCIIWCVST